MVIWANGKNIETWLNGMKITDFVIASTEYANRYKGSKFFPGCGDFGNKYTSGKLVVQDHGGGLFVWIRNVKIRHIDSSPALPKPTISPAGGTINGATKVSLDAGITAYIRYTLDGSEPTETSPLYNDSTGLLINKSGNVTLNAKTFRPGFTTSPSSTAIFTIPGTALAPDGLNAKPDIEYIITGSSIDIVNRNGTSFMVEIMDIKGYVVKSIHVERSQANLSFKGLHSGIYIVKMHTKDWIQTARTLVD
jgi:hypothetical protein